MAPPPRVHLPATAFLMRILDLVIATLDLARGLCCESRSVNRWRRELEVQCGGESDAVSLHSLSSLPYLGFPFLDTGEVAVGSTASLSSRSSRRLHFVRASVW
ncbi:unnamed protein product [Urochloa humidicola]